MVTAHSGSTSRLAMASAMPVTSCSATTGLSLPPPPPPQLHCAASRRPAKPASNVTGILAGQFGRWRLSMLPWKRGVYALHHKYGSDSLVGITKANRHGLREGREMPALTD